MPPPAPTVRDRKKCGAKLRNKDRFCQQPAGYKTPHLGEGKCYLHGGLTPIKHGRYSKVHHVRIRSLMDQLKEQDENVLDLEPEAMLLRAVTIDYLDRYETFVEKLDAWYTCINRERADQKLPPVPRRMPELEDLKDLVEATSRVVERIHKIQKEGSIRLDTFRKLMEQMGVIVAQRVKDETTLQAIEEDWQQIMVDPRSWVRDDGEESPRAHE
jgi:hypothetical protein